MQGARVELKRDDPSAHLPQHNALSWVEMYFTWKCFLLPFAFCWVKFYHISIFARFASVSDFTSSALICLETSGCFTALWVQQRTSSAWFAHFLRMYTRAQTTSSLGVAMYEPFNLIAPSIRNNVTHFLALTSVFPTPPACLCKEGIEGLMGGKACQIIDRRKWLNRISRYIDFIDSSFAEKWFGTFTLMLDEFAESSMNKFAGHPSQWLIEFR